MNTKSLKMLSLLLLTTCLLATFYCYNLLEDNKALASQALRDLNACNQYAETIASLKEKSSQINTASVPKETLSQIITAKIKNLRLNENIFKGIHTSSHENRVADSDYIEESSRLIINDVSLMNLTKILHHTKTKHPGLWVEELNLSANESNGSQHHWDATIKLNYLIYKPLNLN